MSSNGYYSTQSGINAPGNFGVSNTYMPSMTAIASSYQAGSGINNGGIVRELPSSAVSVTTNVFGVSLISVNPAVNTLEDTVNANIGAAVYDRNVISEGTVNIGLYKNNNPYGYQN
jgi:hypothetical protein